MATPVTTNMWSQLANEQAYKEMTNSNMNSKEFPLEYDPIYNKLISQISATMYRELRILQQWQNIGRTAPENEYPGILREVIMYMRKGMNYPMDNGTRPTTLNCYDIIDDEIDVRYHSAQFRWMYGYTIFDQELKRFAGQEGPSMIAQLTEMKAANGISARNMFCDALRKKALNVLATQVAVQLTAPVDIWKDGLTQQEATEWLEWIDNLIFEMEIGSAAYNQLGVFMQIPRGSLQFIMPRRLYYKVMRAAFPETINETRYLQNLIPENRILIDTLGADELATLGSTEALQPTFDANGMNLLNWTPGTNESINTQPKQQCVLMARDCIGVEDNYNATLFGTKDIEKLATPVRMHYWTKCYVTDMLPSLTINS